MTNKNMK